MRLAETSLTATRTTLAAECATVIETKSLSTRRTNRQQSDADRDFRAVRHHHSPPAAVAITDNVVSSDIKDAIDTWIRIRRLAKATGLRDEQSLFVRHGRHDREQPKPLSGEAVYRS